MYNLLNGKTYIGKHRIKDGEKWRSYMGSGRIIINSLKKYGKNNFKKELVAYAVNLEELNAIEKKYIVKEVAAGKGEYNIENSVYGTKILLKDLNVNDDEILSWYFNDKMSWLEIEVKLGVSPTTIYNYMMKKYKGIDPRFDTIIHGQVRDPKTIKRISSSTIYATAAAHKKKECQYCGRVCSISVLSRHEAACKLNPKYKNNYPICAESNCDKQLAKMTAIYCREHAYKYTDYSKLHNNFTPEQNKLGGQTATHNRHHIQKEFYTDFCDLCVEHCNKENIAFTVVKADVKALCDAGITNAEIGKLYGVGKTTVYNWRKQLGL